MLYILDYKGGIVGNPKGYLTAKGCNIALNSKATINGVKWCKLKYYLWDLHQQALDNGFIGTLIYETKYISKMKHTKAKTMKTVPSSIIYRGPSLIDGKPIVVVAIKGSKNAKTGLGMLQTYILNDNGSSPLDNSKHGNDVSICGSCIHRGKPTAKPEKKQAEERSCYVNLGQGPTIVYKALKRGVYPTASPEQIKALGAGSVVRIGTYGDGAAVPRSVWDMLIEKAEGHTGYTHNLKHQPSMAELCMVSADSQQQAASAKSHQRRTFRVIPVATWEAKGSKAVMKNEILCPASKEMDYRTTCDKCKLCNGSSGKGKSIAIVAHGASRNYIKG